MDFDLRLLLVALPVTFALGWLASKLDTRQWRREQRDAPRAYFRGLNFLLNEQQDKAIDVFIEAVQADPDTAELHFALGNLFRRRGEYERAVRVHQHLLQRGDLPLAERERAQHALAQDFLKAGLFDRAEDAFRALLGSSFELEAQQALLALYERSREWAKAADMAAQLEQVGKGSYANRVAHFHCEQALEAQGRGDDATAQAHLAQARHIAPHAARAHVLGGQLLMRQGQPDAAMQAFAALLKLNPDSFNLVARDYAEAALACGQTDQARALLETHLQQMPSMHIVHALARLDASPESQRQRLCTHLQQQPSLIAARQLLQLSHAQLQPDELPLVMTALDRASRPQQRYRCAACGFEAQHYFWQCPGCLSWDSYPPRHVEEL